MEALSTAIIIYLITFYGFNDNPPLWFLIIFGTLGVMIIINGVWMSIYFTSKRKKLMEYMHIKELNINDKLNKWIKTFSILFGIALITNRIFGATRRYIKLDKSKEKASAAAMTITLIAIFVSIFLLFKIIKWQKKNKTVI